MRHSLSVETDEDQVNGTLEAMIDAIIAAATERTRVLSADNTPHVFRWPPFDALHEDDQEFILQRLNGRAVNGQLRVRWNAATRNFFVAAHHQYTELEDGEFSNTSILLQFVATKIDAGGYESGGVVDNIEEILSTKNTSFARRVARDIGRDQPRTTPGGSSYQLHWHEKAAILEVRMPSIPVYRHNP